MCAGSGAAARAGRQSSGGAGVALRPAGDAASSRRSDIDPSLEGASLDHSDLLQLRGDVDELAAALEAHLQRVGIPLLNAGPTGTPRTPQRGHAPRRHSAPQTRDQLYHDDGILYPKKGAGAPSPNWVWIDTMHQGYGD